MYTCSCDNQPLHHVLVTRHVRVLDTDRVMLSCDRWDIYSNIYTLYIVYDKGHRPGQAVEGLVPLWAPWLCRGSASQTCPAT